MLSKLIFFGHFVLICGTERTVFQKEDSKQKSENSATFLTTKPHESTTSIDDRLNLYDEQLTRNGIHDVKAKSISNNFDISTKNQCEEINETCLKTCEYDYFNATEVEPTTNAQLQRSGSSSDKHTHSEVNNSTFAANISDADTYMNKANAPSRSCVKYNTTQQGVIILKDKNDFSWWLHELNNTMSCAVVLFYANWCYFSATLAPIYNAVGRAFTGIPILAIDAYTYNSLNTRYGIVGVPTIILFQESRPVARFNRTRSFKNLVEFIHQNTGMHFNDSVAVSPIDYESGPLPSAPSNQFNFHLLASLCYLICMGMFLMWRWQYTPVFVEYFTSVWRVVTTLLGKAERENTDVTT